MQRLEATERLVTRWARGVALLGLTGLLVVSVSTMLDVLLRWIANAPIMGLNDFNGLAVVIVLAACFPVVVAQRENITIRFLGNALGPRAYGWLEAFGSAVLLAFVSMVSWQLVVFTGELFELGRTTWHLLIPVAPYWAVASALVLLCVLVQAIALIADIVRAVTGRARTESGESRGEGAS